MLCGVCAGIAEYFNLDPTLIRLAWALFCILGGSGVTRLYSCRHHHPARKPGLTTKEVTAMSENDKITEETANDTLPAEVETDLAEQETDVMPAEPEEIAPEDVKIFGMPRHVFHWTAIGAAGGYILAGVVGIIGEQLPGSLFETISGKTNATVWAVVVRRDRLLFSAPVRTKSARPLRNPRKYRTTVSKSKAERKNPLLFP